MARGRRKKWTPKAHAPPPTSEREARLQSRRTRLQVLDLPGAVASPPAFSAPFPSEPTHIHKSSSKPHWKSSLEDVFEDVEPAGSSQRGFSDDVDATHSHSPVRLRRSTNEVELSPGSEKKLYEPQIRQRVDYSSLQSRRSMTSLQGDNPKSLEPPVPESRPRGETSDYGTVAGSAGADPEERDDTLDYARMDSKVFCAELVQTARVRDSESPSSHQFSVASSICSSEESNTHESDDLLGHDDSVLNMEESPLGKFDLDFDDVTSSVTERLSPRPFKSILLGPTASDPPPLWIQMFFTEAQRREVLGDLLCTVDLPPIGHSQDPVVLRASATNPKRGVLLTTTCPPQSEVLERLEPDSCPTSAPSVGSTAPALHAAKAQDAPDYPATLPFCMRLDASGAPLFDLFLSESKPEEIWNAYVPNGTWTTPIRVERHGSNTSPIIQPIFAYSKQSGSRYRKRPHHNKYPHISTKVMTVKPKCLGAHICANSDCLGIDRPKGTSSVGSRSNTVPAGDGPKRHTHSTCTAHSLRRECDICHGPLIHKTCEACTLVAQLDDSDLTAAELTDPKDMDKFHGRHDSSPDLDTAAPDSANTTPVWIELQGLVRIQPHYLAYQTADKKGDLLSLGIQTPEMRAWAVDDQSFAQEMGRGGIPTDAHNSFFTDGLILITSVVLHPLLERRVPTDTQLGPDGADSRIRRSTLAKLDSTLRTGNRFVREFASAKARAG
ncbi:hypothetical protein MVLG_06964 [Microbotryum lychnidis-dioicae p1A1 Lamole]|uniref:Uncharacterized protein n=1 Tax=Microbotryum lychnidis-dioicae (strain p1A1 Lamole / MvSl-1064) TaxID=683840 RepID=U5HIW6_USTV1|nr:hypothetical protein MVLG_06964 [Microbotryum lychnidis-dioicae p1A1 Lamole]|eukprot:KDE02484.1 hypothetical protein MVLG_06964 [Microbotryum lychnidis-dioicae p1A1 Lamole]